MQELSDPAAALPPAGPVRLAPIGDAEWPEEIAALREGFAGGLNVYRTMAHHPALLAAWRELRGHVVIDSALSAEMREIVILRVGRHWRARYEIGQHIVRGRAAGLDDSRIAACLDEAASAAPGADRAMIVAVDTLLANATLEEAQLATLTEALGIAGVFDLMVTVGFYTTLAFIANSFGTPLEPAILAELGGD